MTRFFKGGSSFRGFDRSGVGPYGRFQPALGANKFFIGTTQVSLPLGIPKEVGMRANAFVDFGVLGDTVVSKPGHRYSRMNWRFGRLMV